MLLLSPLSVSQKISHKIQNNYQDKQEKITNKKAIIKKTKNQTKILQNNKNTEKKNMSLYKLDN